MMEAIRYCLANLANFSGRDPRATFWYYVLFLVAVNIVVGMVIGIVFTAGSLGGAINAASSGASEADIQAQVLQQVGSGLATQVWLGAALSVLTLVLFVAAFVRRLRDAALPPALVAIPVATSLFTTYYNVTSVETIQSAMLTGDPVVINEAATAAAGYGMIGWVGYLVVIICGAIPTRAS